MVTLEQVEKLRERANISYDEAKEALEKTNGDILEAIINLEKENRIKEPQGGGYYSTKSEQEQVGNNSNEQSSDKTSRNNNAASFRELIVRFVRWCGKIIARGNENNFEVIKAGEKIVVIPVTILVILLLVAFWITVPILIVGLFLGYKYMFSGPDLGKENVNRAMESVAEAAENLKNGVKDDKGEKSDREDFNHRG